MRLAMVTGFSILLTISAATAGETWRPVGLGGGGGMFSLAVSPLDPWKKLAQKGREHFGAFYHPSRPQWIYPRVA